MTAKQEFVTTDEILSIILGVVDKEETLTDIESCLLTLRIKNGTFEFNRVQLVENERRKLNLDRYTVNELYIKLKDVIHVPRFCNEVKIDLTVGYMPVVHTRFTPFKNK